jgi:ribonuclease VapC
LIVDASALVAIVIAEPGYEDVWRRFRDAERVVVGAPTLVEAGMVLERYVPRLGRTLMARLLDEVEAHRVPFTDAHWPLALDAFLRYGKGRHAAALNFGDCLTYALAKASGEPLLCVGDDFARTDLVLA